MNTFLHWCLTVPVYVQIAADAGLAACVLMGMEFVARRAK